MPAISSYRGNRLANKQTNPQTGPITIHFVTKLSAQCNDDVQDDDEDDDNTTTTTTTGFCLIGRFFWSSLWVQLGLPKKTLWGIG